MDLLMTKLLSGLGTLTTKERVAKLRAATSWNLKMEADEGADEGAGAMEASTGSTSASKATIKKTSFTGFEAGLWIVTFQVIVSPRLTSVGLGAEEIFNPPSPSSIRPSPAAASPAAGIDATKPAKRRIRTVVDRRPGLKAQHVLRLLWN
jgi:hypothetical protein